MVALSNVRFGETNEDIRGALYTSLDTIDFRLPDARNVPADTEGPLTRPLSGSSDIYCRLQDMSIKTLA